MKRNSAVFVTATITLILAAAFLSTYPVTGNSLNIAKNCFCTAPDGSCSATVTCTGGCTSSCGNNDNCSASCSGFYGYFANEVNLDMRNASYPQLVAELAQVSGKDLAFSPAKPDLTFNVGFKSAPLWDALDLLSEQGTVRVDGHDFEKLKRLRSDLLAGEKVSFNVKNTPLNTFVNDMVGLTGLKLTIAGGSPRGMVNIQLQEATLNDILAAAAAQTGARIVEDGGSHH